jgi:hypothetical protein
MNRFILSASKAFMNGFYASPSNQSDVVAQIRSVVGWGEVERQALGEKTFGVVSLCLFIASVLSYGLLIRSLLVTKGEPFILRYLLPVLYAVKEDSFLDLD